MSDFRIMIWSSSSTVIHTAVDALPQLQRDDGLMSSQVMHAVTAHISGICRISGYVADRTGLPHAAFLGLDAVLVQTIRNAAVGHALLSHHENSAYGL